MRAVVLVGGFGTRLRPLTLSHPKQMLPVGGVTMIERVISALARHGIDEAVLSLGYRADPFRAAFDGDVCAGVALRYAEEPEPLDTAGAIAFAARAAGIDDTFVAVNGDVLTDLDVAGLIAAHRRFGGAATIALTPVEDPSRYGVVPTGDDGRVIGFIEKPPAGTAPSNWINAGTYVLEPEVLDMVEPGAPSSIERDVFPRLAESGRLFAVQSEVYWLDAGTHGTYRQAHVDLIGGARGAPETAIDAEADVDPTAKVESSWIGPGARIAAGTEIRGSVVLANAEVGPGAVVIDSIVAEGARVGRGARCEDVVVGFDAEVDDHAVLNAALVPDESSWS